MKEQIKIALWNKVKSTYLIGTSKHTNALLEEDFDSFIEDVVKICAIPSVSGCNTDSDKLTECSNCGDKVEMISNGEFCPHCFC